MKDNETIVEMITRFINIVNGIEALGKTYKELEMVMKILRSLPSKWDANVIVIQEAKDLTKLHVRKFRLIQPMVITLKGGEGGVNRVMISFCKFKLCEWRDKLYASI